MVERGRLCCSLYKTQEKLCGGQINAVDDDTSPIFVAQAASTYEREGVTTFGQTVPHFYGQIQIIKPDGVFSISMDLSLLKPPS